MTCLDVSAGGEFICPEPERLPWLLQEIPYTGLDALTLIIVGVALVFIGLAIIRLNRKARR